MVGGGSETKELFCPTSDFKCVTSLHERERDKAREGRAGSNAGIGCLVSCELNFSRSLNPLSNTVVVVMNVSCLPDRHA